jgi:hypothetical protein
VSLTPPPWWIRVFCWQNKLFASSCFAALLLADPADGYQPYLVWIGQQTSLHSLFLVITDAFQLEVFLLSPKLLLVVLLYHYYNIYYKLYYVASVATLLLLLCCDFPFATIPIRTPQHSTVPGISHTSILKILARLLLCSHSRVLLLSLPYSCPVRLPSSGSCTIFCTHVTITQQVPITSFLTPCASPPH